MEREKLSNRALCQDFMDRICTAIFGSAKRQVNYLKHGPKTTVEQEMGKYILALSSLDLTKQQLDALESAFRQIQEELISWIFSIIDGSTQPPGWPDEVRLVNMETGEAICPGELERNFGLTLAEHRIRHKSTS